MNKNLSTAMLECQIVRTVNMEWYGLVMNSQIIGIEQLCCVYCSLKVIEEKFLLEYRVGEAMPLVFARDMPRCHSPTMAQACVELKINREESRCCSMDTAPSCGSSYIVLDWKELCVNYGWIGWPVG